VAARGVFKVGSSPRSRSIATGASAGVGELVVTGTTLAPPLGTGATGAGGVEMFSPPSLAFLCTGSGDGEVKIGGGEKKMGGRVSTFDAVHAECFRSMSLPARFHFFTCSPRDLLSLAVL
jgi:hypothetical protein